MPKSSTPFASPASVQAVQAEIDTAYLTLLRSVSESVASLEPSAASSLPVAVAAAVNAGVEQKVLAERLGVSRATVSRWMQNLNVPASAAFRKAMFLEIVAVLANVTEERERAHSKPTVENSRKRKL